MKKKKKNYTIQQNRRIVTCPECKKGKIEGMECYNCKEIDENKKQWDNYIAKTYK